MLNFLKKLTFSPLELLPSLDEYNIQGRPRKSVKVEKEKRTDGTVHDGREWRTEWDKDGNLSSEQVKGEVPVAPNMVVLDEYDSAFLDYSLGKDWKRDETKAKVMKWHWLREESAQRIQEYHTANGKLERGYSERTASVFVKAFYAADDEREKDGKKRQRMATFSTAENEFDWS